MVGNVHVHALCVGVYVRMCAHIDTRVSGCAFAKAFVRELVCVRAYVRFDVCPHHLLSVFVLGAPPVVSATTAPRTRNRSRRKPEFPLPRYQYHCIPTLSI